MPLAIKVENLSKAYQLGQFTTRTLSLDIERWWALARGKEDPFLKIGDANDRSTKGKSDVAWALKDINFEIEQGNAVGIIGKNGAGKSTLLKLLSKVTSPTTGLIKSRGRIASLLEVGTGFHQELTGRENIFLNGAILGMRKREIERKFDEIVDFSGVERYIDTPVKRYSSGMYVRLAFAVAAHLESEILIVDEVLAVGDAEFQKKCLGKMGDISKGEGRTLLFVSHNMSAIKGLCPFSILLKNGNICSQGESNKVISYYLESESQLTLEGDISASTYRKGGQRLKLLDYKIENTNDNSSGVNCGDSAIFKVTLKCNEKLITNLRFGLAIKKADLLVTELNSYYGHKKRLECSQGEYEINFIWHKVPIQPGIYSFSIIVTSGLEILDWVVDIGYFEVHEGQFYSTGQMPLPGNYPLFFTDFDFKMGQRLVSKL